MRRLQACEDGLYLEHELFKPVPNYCRLHYLSSRPAAELTGLLVPTRARVVPTRLHYLGSRPAAELTGLLVSGGGAPKKGSTGVAAVT